MGDLRSIVSDVTEVSNSKFSFSGIRRKDSTASHSTTASSRSSSSKSSRDSSFDKPQFNGYASDVTDDDEDDEYQYPSTPIVCLRIPCDDKPPHLISVPAVTTASAASLGCKKYHHLDLTGRLPQNKLNVTPQSFINRTHPELSGTYYVHWLDSRCAGRFPENKAAAKRGFWGKDEGGPCYGDVYIVKVKNDSLDGLRESRVCFEDVNERYLTTNRLCRSGSINDGSLRRQFTF